MKDERKEVVRLTLNMFEELLYDGGPVPEIVGKEGRDILCIVPKQ